MLATASFPSFICRRRRDLIDLCLGDAQLSSAQAEEFRSFCLGLSTQYFSQYFLQLEQLQESYAPFDPSGPGRPSQGTENCLRQLDSLATAAGYQRLSSQQIEKQLPGLYARAASHQNRPRLQCYCREAWPPKADASAVTEPPFEQLLILYQSAASEPAPGADSTPGEGSIYLHSFCNISGQELRSLFSRQPRPWPRQRLLLPGLGVLIAGAVLVLPAPAAAALVLAAAGLAASTGQRIGGAAAPGELITSNVANHGGVLPLLAATAAAAAVDGMIVTYYHLLTSQRPLTLAELEVTVERWRQRHRYPAFDLTSVVRAMGSLQGPTPWRQQSLLKTADDGCLWVLDLPAARALTSELSLSPG